MLKFKDGAGNVKFLLRDSDTQPVDVDRLVMDNTKSEEEAESTEEDKKNKETN